MSQLTLLSNVTSVDHKAPREERMGAVERQHWPAGPGEGAWSLGPSGWEVSGAEPRALLVGIDEAGRGPLAGPVSVGAVALSPDQLTGSWGRRLDDSKRLSHQVRSELFEEITSRAPAWVIVHVHSDHVDKVNILQATYHGMCIATEFLLGVGDIHRAWAGRPEALRTVSFAGGVAAGWYAETIEALTPPMGADVLCGVSDEAIIGRSARLLVDGHRPFKVQGAEAAKLTQFPVVKGDALSHHIAAASILAKHSRDLVMKRCAEVWPEYGFGGHKGYPTAEHLKAVKSHGPCPVHRMSFGPVARALEARRAHSNSDRA